MGEQGRQMALFQAGQSDAPPLLDTLTNLPQQLRRLRKGRYVPHTFFETTRAGLAGQVAFDSTMRGYWRASSEGAARPRS
jgi:hypothetical protein